MYPNPTNGELFTDLFIDFKGQSMRVIVKDTEGNIHVSRQVPIEDKLSKMNLNFILYELIRKEDFLVQIEPFQKIPLYSLC